MHNQTYHMPMMRLTALLVGFALLMAGCFGQNKPKAVDLRQHGSKAQVAGDGQTALQAATLTIGQQIVSELHSDLIGSGLTEEDAGIITASAQASLEVEAGRIAVSGLNLTGEEGGSAVEVALPAIIAGAINALAQAKATASDMALKEATTQVIMGASFASLKGRTSDLSQALVDALSKKMVTSAVKNIAAAGFNAAASGQATGAITAGAVGALKRSGLSAELVSSVAQQVVAGTIEGLASLDWTDSSDHIASAVSRASAGAFAQIGNSGLGDEAQVVLAGNLSASAMVSLGTLKKQITSATVSLNATVKEISQRSVAALKGGNLAGSLMASTLESVTGSLVAGLDAAGFDSSMLAKGAGSVSAGAIVGMGEAGFSDDELAQQGLVKNVMAGTLGSLQAVNLSAIERASAMTEIAELSMAGIGESGIRSATARETIINSMMEGSLSGLQGAGFTERSLVELAVENLTRGTTTALASAGVETASMSSMTGRLAKSSVSTLASSNLNDSTETFKVLMNTVAKGLMEGLSSLQAAGKVDQTLVNNSATLMVAQAVAGVKEAKDSARLDIHLNELSDISGELAGGALQGLAVGGMQASAIAALKNDMSTAVAGDLRSAGVEESKIVAFQSQVDTHSNTAESLATTMASPLAMPYCVDDYHDKIADQEFFAKLVNLPRDFLCRVEDIEACPKRRTSTQIVAEWQRVDLARINRDVPYACRLQRQLLAEVLPGAFALLNTQSTVGPRPIMQWEKAEGALRYEVVVARERSCSPEQIVEKATTKELELTVPALASGNYFVCVNAYNVYGLKSAAAGSPLAISVDAEAPSMASISIAGDYTSAATVTVNLSAPGSDKMYLTTTAGCGEGGAWEPYSASKSGVTLGTRNGPSSVYVRFRDTTGNETDCVSDAIIHDSVPPERPESLSLSGAAFSAAKAPGMSWTASSDSGSGLNGYEVAIGSSQATWEHKGWTNVGLVTSLPYVHELDVEFTPGVTYYAHVRARDHAGNVSNAKSTAFTYERWQQEAYIKASNADAGDIFGHVSLYGDTIAVGALYEQSNQTTITNGTASSSDNSITKAGAVYVYKRTASSWNQEAYIKAANNQSYDAAEVSSPGHEFGDNVVLFGDTLVVGAPHEDSEYASIINGTTANTTTSHRNSGAVYVYQRTGSQWAQQAYIKAAHNSIDPVERARPNDASLFGNGVALSNDTLVVGMYFDQIFQTTISAAPPSTFVGTDNASTGSVRSGAAFVYQRTGTSWASQAYIKAPNMNQLDHFGSSVAVEGDTVVVGAPFEDGGFTTVTNGTTADMSNPASGEDSGAVYVYERTGTSWAQTAYIKPSNNRVGSHFGNAVALSGHTLVVGAEKEDSDQTTVTNGTASTTDNDFADSGAAYIFKRDPVTRAWSQEAYLKASNAASGEEFAKSVAIEGDIVIIGAPFEDGSQASISYGTTASDEKTKNRSGAVYVYKRIGTTWSQDAYLKASNNSVSGLNADGVGNQFGMTVAIHGDTLAVGADTDSSNQTTITNGTGASLNTSATKAGAVYIFKRR